MENIFAPNQRIVILQSIEKDPGRCLSNEMLQRALKGYGHSCSVADVNVLINWLERRGYVTAERLVNGLILAHITRPGIDVASGNLRAEGIDPPLQE
jgi:hypothetical protein